MQNFSNAFFCLQELALFVHLVESQLFLLQKQTELQLVALISTLDQFHCCRLKKIGLSFSNIAVWP